MIPDTVENMPREVRIGNEWFQVVETGTAVDGSNRGSVLVFMDACGVIDWVFESEAEWR